MTEFRISFHVPGNVVPKQRARARSGGKGYYAPRAKGSTRLSYPEYKELVQAECFKAIRSRSYPECVGRIALYRLENPDAPPLAINWPWAISVKARLGRGDADNVLGSIMDALNGILWKDDAQVLQASVMLERVGPKQPRGVDMECWTLGE